MNKTPKLKSRTLGLRNRGLKGTALAFTDSESDVNVPTQDLLLDHRHAVKENHVTSNKAEHKQNIVDMSTTICLKENGRNSDMVTPVKTQKLVMSRDESSSDEMINDESPDLRRNISRTFSSPEIEVTWDYSCSQVSSESVVPVRRIRRKRFPKALPPLNLHPRHKPVTEISKEEIKKQINCLKGFYSDLFINIDSPLPSTTNSSHDDIKMGTSKENFQHIRNTTKCDILNKNEMEPTQNQSEEQINSFFNDSSNDIILECTQAAEEELFEYSKTLESSQMVKRSEINMNSSKSLLVNNNNESTNVSEDSSGYAKNQMFSNLNKNVNDVKSPSRSLIGRSKSKECVKNNSFLQHNSVPNQSCLSSREHQEKSVVKGREYEQRLTSSNGNKAVESGNRVPKENIDEFFDDSIDEIMLKCSQDVEEELLSLEIKQPSSGEQAPSKKHFASPLVKCSKVIKTSYKQTVHTRSRSSENVNLCGANLNLFVDKQKVENVGKGSSSTSAVNLNITKVNGVKISSHDAILKHKPPKMSASRVYEREDTDISALLNDDDAYLTSIDFSTIDLPSTNKTTVAPLVVARTKCKIYSQNEIEAKRKEALDKLRRKRLKM